MTESSSEFQEKLKSTHSSSDDTLKPSALVENKEDIEGDDEPKNSSGWGDYPLDTVFVRSETRTVNEIVSRIKKERYKLDPDFQRDFVWTATQQSRLIESSLMRIPLPVLYVAEDSDGTIVVVDGLQRLTTFFNYINNKFALTGIGEKAEHVPSSHATQEQDTKLEIVNKKFKDLPVKLQERIEDTQLTLYILDAKAPEHARLDIFERVNGGQPLTRQQMRNCLYSGKATQWLKTSARRPAFLKATGKSLKAKTMRDREAINRFCAFYLLGLDPYKGDMDEFLAIALKKMNKMDEKDLDSMMQAFDYAMTRSYEVFKKHSFRKSITNDSNDGDRKKPLNISLFDCLSTGFARHKDALHNKSNDEIKQRIKELLHNGAFISSITNSPNNIKPAQLRHNAISEALLHPELSIKDIISQNTV